MKTESNEIIPNKLNLNLNEDFLNEKFVKYINNLSDSIKEYYKLSTNNNIYTTILVNDLEKVLNSSAPISNIIYNINNVPSHNEVSKKINENFKKLKENINSEELNLKKFFEDAKFIFKKMKNKRKEYIQNKLIKQMNPDAHQKINTDMSNIRQKFIKEIDALNKQILVIKKQLSDEQLKNHELKKENNMLKNKHEFELSQLSKRNTELSKSLMNNQNELLNLQKEILDKTKEIEILKKSSINNQDSQKLIESIKSVFEECSIKNSKNSVNKPWNNLNESLNRILENYKNENQKLKIDFHEKIAYYQEQLKKTKNELLEKMQINMENDIRSKKEINDIKNDYDKKMEEVNNKNRIIDNYINLCQEANNNLMNRIRQINQKVSAQEMKIYQLEEENQELNEKIRELYNLKDSHNLNDIDLGLKEENINLKKNLEEQNKTNEDLREEIKVISNERDSYHRRLLSLGIKYIGVHESKITRDEGFELLNDEVKQLKEQNETLKDMIETLIKDFLSKYKEKKEEDEKYDDEKGKLKEQYDIIEELKQKVFKVIKGQGNNDIDTGEINSLKKENEKLIEQILKLSDEKAKIQKEHEALQKQYHTIKNEKGGIPNIGVK